MLTLLPAPLLESSLLSCDHSSKFDNTSTYLFPISDHGYTNTFTNISAIKYRDSRITRITIRVCFEQVYLLDSYTCYTYINNNIMTANLQKVTKCGKNKSFETLTVLRVCILCRRDLDDH